MVKKSMQNILIEGLAQMKAINVQALNVTKRTSLTDCMIIATGTSSRHVHALADRVMALCKAHLYPVLGVEGLTHSEWILVDIGALVVHIMLAETRRFYALESLWGNHAEDGV